MGMFDDYQPVPAIDCPWCGRLISVWQGRDGPNVLVLWVQGQRRPADALPDEAELRPTGALDELELPESFRIIGWCPADHRTEARCACDDGVWTETDYSKTQQLADEATERRRIDLLRRSWSRRKYEYVGDGAEAAATTPPGKQIMRRRDLNEFLADRTDEAEEPFTYVVVDGLLRVSPRRSEHVACAGHGPVEAAGEISFDQDDERLWRVSEVSNQSAGYCPESSCFDAVEDALWLPGIEHPGGFTSAFELPSSQLRRSTGPSGTVEPFSRQRASDYFRRRRAEGSASGLKRVGVMPPGRTSGSTLVGAARGSTVVQALAAIAPRPAGEDRREA
jgi:hypothetical protein